ncbi:MAG: sodium:solute symporter [Gammaproteobacteria bacterium]|nr:sodium:solute symporter [Gammaproteobacteria bacterium]
MTINISGLDAAIIIAYLLAVLALGIWLGRGRQSAARYFLGDRSLPWGALLLSIVATETSTVTFLSLPGLAAAAGGNLTFLQITFGYIAGRIGVIFILMPLYFRGQPFTAYEVLETRFGMTTRRLVSSLFLLTRNASDALRLFLTALVLQIVLGVDLNLSVIIIGSVTILYTFIGGARSVIWNDCVQFFIYMLGAVAAGYVIVNTAPGGFEHIMQFANDSDKLRIFDFDISFSKSSMTFWAGLAGGAFLTAATHGTDQMMVQRYLSARNQRDASLALGISGFIVLLQFALFLLIGVGLATMFGITDAGSAANVKNDQLFPYFIVHYMPPGLLGITLAAVFAAAMSTLSSSLNSSAAAFINDIWLPLRKNEANESTKLIASRTATIVFGLVQTGIALAFGLIASNESIVANVLKISGFAAGPVLGLYFLGVFAPRVRQRSALTGFVLGVGVLSVIAYSTAVHWAWYALFGSAVTLVSGVLAHLLEERKLEQ